MSENESKLIKVTNITFSDRSVEAYNTITKRKLTINIKAQKSKTIDSGFQANFNPEHFKIEEIPFVEVPQPPQETEETPKVQPVSSRRGGK